jgi:hypothetical protein
MGAHLGSGSPQSLDQSSSGPDEASIPIVPWLDDQTSALVRAIIATVARQHPPLLATILFGSVARHQERPLSAPDPSDVDLLLLFDLGPGKARIAPAQTLAICESIGQALDHYRYPPREVQTVLAVANLADWDTTFVENLARDGLLVWARGPLPPPLAALALRALPGDHAHSVETLSRPGTGPISSSSGEAAAGEAV